MIFNRLVSISHGARSVCTAQTNQVTANNTESTNTLLSRQTAEAYPVKEAVYVMKYEPPCFETSSTVVLLYACATCFNTAWGLFCIGSIYMLCVLLRLEGSVT
jgi:hypothetical protein